MRLTLLTLLLLIPSLPAQDWPRFRGPNGTGLATGKDIPSEFSAKAGILWKLAIPGVGNSSPVVSGNHLFLQTASKDGRERFLVCVDVSGKILWQRSIPGQTASTHAKNSLASSTPATDGERVYAAFWDGDNVSLVAYDFKGEPQWHRQLGSFVSQHGAGASPIVYKNLVFFANDMDGKAILYCFDAKTGEKLWDKEREAFRACYSAPLILSRDGAKDELVITSTTSINGYEPETGKVLWNWVWDWNKPGLKKKGNPLRTVASTVYGDDMLFACSGDGGGDRNMCAIALAGTGKDARPKLAWDNQKDFPYVPCPVFKDDHLYFAHDRGFVGCYEAKDGKRVWFERVDDGTASITASPVLIDDRIFLASEEGDVFCFSADPAKFERLGRSELGETIRATPAVAGGRLYIRGQQHLFCIGKK